MRKFLATTAAGLALATGSVAMATLTPIGSAFAQDGTTQTAPAEGQAQGGRHGQLRPRIIKAAIKSAAEAIGIPAQDLATALKSGQSVADVARAHNVDPQVVVDKLVADATARIDQAVANGKLDQARADQIKAQLHGRVTSLVNRHFDGSHRPQGTPPS